MGLGSNFLEEMSFYLGGYLIIIIYLYGYEVD